MINSKLLIGIILVLLFNGCGDSIAYLSHEERLVSKVLQSEQTLYLAYQQNEEQLISENILHAEDYHYRKEHHEEIFSLDLHVGSATFSYDGYRPYTLHDTDLDFDRDTTNQDYVYDYQGYLYDGGYGRYQFNTSYAFVGRLHNNPHKGVMKIIGEDETIIVHIQNEHDVHISVFNHHDSYRDRTIYTNWQSLGF